MRSYLTARRVSATCSECGSIHEGVPVAADEDGSYADLDTKPCHDDACTKRLCTDCPQFTCDCCGLTFCLIASHVGQEIEPECTCVQVDVDQDDNRGCELHGTRYPKTLYFCRTCAAPEEMVAAKAPVTDYSQITEAQAA